MIRGFHAFLNTNFDSVPDTLKIGWKQNTFTRIRSVFGYGA